MAIYLDKHTIYKTFLDKILAGMRRALLCNENLFHKINTRTKVLVYAIRYKWSTQTANYYKQHGSHWRIVNCQAVKVGTFLAKQLEMKKNHNLQFVVLKTISIGQWHRNLLNTYQLVRIVDFTWIKTKLQLERH